MTEKLLFRFGDTLVRNDGVIPAWQNAKRFEIDKRFLLIGNMVASFILFSIQIRTTTQASFCFGGANEFDDGLIIYQGHACPIRFDVTKQTMLN